MNKITKKATVLVYTLILVSLSLVMGAVILSSATTLSLNYNFVNTSDKLSRFMSDNSRIVFKLAKDLNSNGDGFVDNLRCPQNISMSGSTTSATIQTTFLADEALGIYCQGNGADLQLYFNSDFTDIVIADYKGSRINLVDSGVGKVGQFNFSDSDNTFIDFSSYNINMADGIDDNGNSDNYSSFSTGSIAYGFGFSDDDILHRKIKLGYVPPGAGFNSIFWNNNATSKVIKNNLNNADGINDLIGDSSGIIKLDSDKDYSLFLYKFDKSAFIEYNDLETIERLSGENITAGVGYIQNNSGVLSLSGVKTGNEYVFDFVNYDYALLLENITTEVLSYKVTSETLTGTGIYIVPIEDEDPLTLKYYANIIIIDEDLRLIHDDKEIVGTK